MKEKIFIRQAEINGYNGIALLNQIRKQERELGVTYSDVKFTRDVVKVFYTINNGINKGKSYSEYYC